jgi:hypothetical protein
MKARQKAQQIARAIYLDWTGIPAPRDSYPVGDHAQKLIDVIEQALQESAKVECKNNIGPCLINTGPTIDPWEGRHVTDGKVCFTCNGIALKDCPVIGRMSKEG